LVAELATYPVTDGLRLLIVPEDQAGAAEAQAILSRTETAAEFQQRLDLVEAINPAIKEIAFLSR
jgi:hypothetical protein